MTFKYERQLIEQNGLGMILPLSRLEVKDRLVDFVLDTEVAVVDLEAHPGEWTRLTPFAFYRAVLKGEHDD